MHVYVYYIQTGMHRERERCRTMRRGYEKGIDV